MTMCECIGCEIVKIKDHMRGAVWNAHAAGFVVGISGGIDSAVACAFHLSLTPSVRAIPLSLFGKDIETGSVDYDEAIRQAEIYACVAEKSKKMNRKAADEYNSFLN